MHAPRSIRVSRAVRFAAAAILLLSGMRLRAAGGAEEARVDPAGLLRAAIAEENKIHDLEGLLLRIEGKWTRSAKEIAAERADLEKKYPGLEITAERFPALRPETKEILELAFDRSRLRDLHVEEDISSILRIWDGRQTWIHTKYETHDQESYFLGGEPKDYFAHLDGLFILRAGAHSFWWNPSRVKVGAMLFHYNSKDELVTTVWGTPEEYELTGRRVRRGRDCHVLDLRRWSGVFLRRLYVGVADRQIHGEMNFARVDAEAIMARIAGAPIPDASAWEAWLKRLPPIERRKAARRCLDEMYEAARPRTEWYFDDYREVSPGFSIPTKLGYIFLEQDAEGMREKSRRDLRIAEAKVNVKLSDEMFAMEMREGVKVYDGRYDPPLSYRYKKDFSPEEWQKILDENERASNRLAEMKAEMDSRIGERAVEFPETPWVNSKPMTWADLKGRVVVLDFCAHWCGPCRDDLPVMESLHKSRDRSGIAVIGVHTPTGSIDDVRKMTQTFGLSYPICIDAQKPSGASGFGFLSSWYHVRGIPHAVVVDKEGRVAGHGSLDEALRKAEEIASDPTRK
ncbi:MAG: TlpA family protein disulfide reductase [Planctomycetes bacterium]|nr:TlpA family protein disulfide reductase [Planctomycetota bacterium]